jgi:hypothetical protein
LRSRPPITPTWSSTGRTCLTPTCRSETGQVAPGEWGEGGGCKAMVLCPASHGHWALGTPGLFRPHPCPCCPSVTLKQEITRFSTHLRSHQKPLSPPVTSPGSDLMCSLHPVLCSEQVCSSPRSAMTKCTDRGSHTTTRH